MKLCFLDKLRQLLPIIPNGLFKLWSTTKQAAPGISAVEFQRGEANLNEQLDRLPHRGFRAATLLVEFSDRMGSPAILEEPDQQGHPLRRVDARQVLSLPALMALQRFPKSHVVCSAPVHD